jgi:hypothetical protein
LKTLEKINRKGIRNSLKTEKLNSAQIAQAGPTPRQRARTRAPAPACFARMLPPLSPSRCPVGQSCRRRFSRARAPFLPLRGWPYPSVLTARSRISLLLPRGSHPSAPSAVPNLSPTHPTMDAPTTARSLATFSRPLPFRSPHTARPLSPRSFAPLAELSCPLSRLAHATKPSVAAHRSSSPVLQPTLSPCRTLSSVSSVAPPVARDTPRFAPNPSGLSGPCSSESSPCSRRTPPST